jgi:hypothetical protein
MGLIDLLRNGLASLRRESGAKPYSHVAIKPGLATKLIITPNDDGYGGTFSVGAIELTPDSPTATFTYTPPLLAGKLFPEDKQPGRVFVAPGSVFTITAPPQFPPMQKKTLWETISSLLGRTYEER